jgi:hypothetical protein
VELQRGVLIFQGLQKNFEWKYHQKNMGFLGQDPVRYKIAVDKKCLKVNNFKYLDCEIYYEN